MMLSVFMFLGLDVHGSVPYSKTIIFGGSVAVFLHNMRLRRPKTEAEPLIAWDIVMLMEPGSVVGVTIGVVLNTIFPEYLLLIGVSILLVYFSRKMIKKGKMQMKAEQPKDKTQAAGKGEGTAGERVGSPVKATPLSAVPLEMEREGEEDIAGERDAPVVATSESVELSAPETSPVPKSESEGEGEAPKAKAPNNKLDTAPNPDVSVWTRVSKPRLAVFLTLWLSVMAISRVQGDSAIVDQCSPLYWTLFWVKIALGCVTAVCLSLWVRRDWLKGVPVNLGGVASLSLQTPWEVSKFFLFGVAAGAVAAMFGLGGGILKTPILLEVGVGGLVTRATSQTMILFTASSSFVQYALLGRIPFSMALPFFICGCLAFPTGMLVSKALMTRMNTQAVIPIIVGCVLAGSFVAIFLSTGIDTIMDTVDNGFEAFHSLCE
ncbi:transmembrane protein TauE-like [Kipferlia bialata]|uniref:Transmembrane protein TauE-like n=1 Tax=Kipferlia bialata TaxID=797122 RepID=A0A9K3CTE1_9EUKA|nr:transmembrane protein TauE-like [Kipferlia bialata]|eukprot:g4210.t1